MKRCCASRVAVKKCNGNADNNNALQAIPTYIAIVFECNNYKNYAAMSSVCV